MSSFIQKYNILETLKKRENIYIYKVQKINDTSIYFIYRISLEKDARYKTYIEDYAKIKSFAHPNILSFVEIHRDDKYFFVTYKRDSISLEEYIQNSDTPMALDSQLCLAAQLVSATHTLAENNISHCHISPENIQVNVEQQTIQLDYFLDEKIANVDRVKPTESFSNDSLSIYNTLYQLFSWKLFDSDNIDGTKKIIFSNAIPEKQFENNKKIYIELENLLENFLAQKILYGEFHDKIHALVPMAKAMEHIPFQTTLIEIPSMRINNIAGYKILEVLGQGGMGIIYKVWNESLGKHLALKVIKKDSLKEKRTVKRFLHEAQTIAKLNHTNIVKIYSMGEEQDICYFTMDYIEGQTLDIFLKENILSFKEMAFIFAKVASTLEYAHKNDVIHRDLKPSNIMINNSRQIFLVDFGISQWRNDEKNLTATGNILGTPFFMSPEQTTGQKSELTPASDTYSLGVVLYQALTGTVPFDGDNLFQIVHKIHNQKPVPLRKRNSKIPKNLENICLKALQKDPLFRYRSASELSDDLMSFTKGKSIKFNHLRLQYVWRNPLKIFCGIVIAIFLCLSFYQTNQQSMDINIKKDTQNRLLYLNNLLNNHLYLEVQEEIEKIQSHPDMKNQNLQEYTLVALIGLKEYEKALSFYEKKLKSSSCSSFVYIALAKLYQDLDKWNEVEHIFTKLKDEDLSPIILGEKMYIKGKMYLAEDNYPSAYKNFSLSVVYLHQSSSFYHLAQLYTIVCDFEMNNAQDIEQRISALRKIEPYLKNEPLVYEYLGKSYAQKNLLEEALKCFNRCVLLCSGKSEYYRYCCEINLKLEQLDIAFDNLRNSLTLDYNNTSLLQQVFKNHIVYPEKIFDLFKLIKDVDSERGSSPFSKIFEQIEKKYYGYYIKFVELSASSEENWQESAIQFLEQIHHEDTHISESAFWGLVALRHKKGIIQFLFQELAKVDDLQKYTKLNKAINTIQKQSQQERKFAIYYQMAYFYLYKSQSVLKDLQQKELSETFRKILDDKTESVYIRYLAAFILAWNLEIDILEEYTLQSEDLTAQIIAIVVQREWKIPCPYIHLIEKVETIDNPFLLALWSKSLYMDGEQKKELYLDKISSCLENLLSNNDSVVVLYAAGSALCFENIENQELLKKAKAAILTFMFSPDKTMRYIAHKYYWKTLQVRQEYAKEIYQKQLEATLALKDSDLDLLLISTFVDNQDMGSFYIDMIHRIIRRYPTASWEKIKAVFALSVCGQDDPLILSVLANDNDEFSFLSRSFTFFSSKLSKIFKAFQDKEMHKVSNIFVDLRQVRNDLPQEKDLYFKIFVYHALSLLGIECALNIEKEKDPLAISAILVGIPITHVFREKFPLSMLLPDQVSISQKILIVDKYLEHPNKVIFKAALWAKMPLVNKKSREYLVEKYGVDDETRKHLGRALLNIIHRQIIYTMLVSRLANYREYVKDFLYIYSEEALTLFGAHNFDIIFREAIPLSNESPSYFLRALSYIAQSKKDSSLLIKAEQNIRKAIKMDVTSQKKDAYSIYLAEVISLQGRKSEALKILQDLNLVYQSEYQLEKIIQLYLASSNPYAAKKPLLLLLSKTPRYMDSFLHLPGMYIPQKEDYVYAVIDYLYNIEITLRQKYSRQLKFKYFTIDPRFEKFLLSPEIQQLKNKGGE